MTVRNPFNYDATDASLQRQLMLAVMVAGKHAAVQERKLDALLARMREYAGRPKASPFELLATLWERGGRRRACNGAEAQALVKRTRPRHPLVALLQEIKTGQYVRLTWCFLTLARLYTEGMNLRKATRAELHAIPGIGLKTASFFILFTRRDVQMACLDTHILAYMREHNITDNVPKASPADEGEYARLEGAFLARCRRLNRQPADLDFEIWKQRSVTMRDQCAA